MFLALSIITIIIIHFDANPMASNQTFSLLKLSLGVSVPLVIDLAYQEGYFVPSTFPGFYNEGRLKELKEPSRPRFTTPPSLTFVRYRTENPWHVQYVYAKKSFWRYNVMWWPLGVLCTALQSGHIVNSVRKGRPAGAIAGAAVIGLTWTVMIVEGKARTMFLNEIYDTVIKEEEAFTNRSKI